MRAGSPAAHALLRHLEMVGFDASPRLLGVDDLGREVLSYVDGETPRPPYPEWALTDLALASVARLLRRYHDAAWGFDPAPHAWGTPLPERFRTPLVSHNDPNLDNIVFRDGRAVALLDFDLAAPGSRVWDIATAARLWCPLRPDRDVSDRRRGQGLRRLRIFVDAYGLDRQDRESVVGTLIPSHDWGYGIVRAAVADGHQAFTEEWLGGGAHRARRARRWYERNRPELVRALLSTPSPTGRA